MSKGPGGRAKRTPSPDWQAFQATLLHPDQIAYEIVRPVVVLGQDIKARAAEVGVAPRTLARKVEQFVQLSIPGLVANHTRNPTDKRLLPPPERAYLLQLKAEYPPFTPRELASLLRCGLTALSAIIPSSGCWRRTCCPPSPVGAFHTTASFLQLPRAATPFCGSIWTAGVPQPLSTTCIDYLQAPRTTVYDFLKRWAKDAVLKPLGDKKCGRRPGGRKVTWPVVATVKTLQEQTHIGEFRRISHGRRAQAAVWPRPESTHLRAHHGRTWAKKRDLYGIGIPRPAPEKPKKPMPFATQIPHRWSVDLCYIEKHGIPDIKGPRYVWTILDNYSRQIVASAPSKTQALWDFLLILFTAIYVPHMCMARLSASYQTAAASLRPMWRRNFIPPGHRESSN